MNSRLPGIEFLVHKTEVPETLPRMDIAAFVGFSAKGPIGVPVLLEDSVQFESVFGGALELAWDPQEGRMHTAHLADTVRAFFHGGGERCWVVRVADLSQASYQRFPLPGMLVKDAADCWVGAEILASSQGAWADDVLLGAQLQRLDMPLDALLKTEVVEGQAVPRFWVSTDPQNRAYQNGAFQAGELLRIRQDNTEWFLRLVRQQQDENGQDNLVLEPVQKVLRLNIGSSTQQSAGRVRLLNGEGASREVKASLDASGRLVAPLSTTQSKLPTPQPGMTLTMAMDGSDAQAAGRVWALQVQEASREWGADGEFLELRLSDAWQLAAPADINHTGFLDGLTFPLRGERLTVQLDAYPPSQFTRQDQPERRTQSRAPLHFDPTHAESWTRLPRDEDRYLPPDSINPVATDTATAASGFAFAADPDPDTNSGQGLHGCIPLGLDRSVARTKIIAHGDHGTESRPARNGLASMSAGLFSDAALMGVSVDALPGLAFHHRYQSAQAGPLAGMHSLYFVPEPSLISLPDAVHPQWQETQVEQGGGALPTVPLSLQAESKESVLLTWTHPTQHSDKTEADAPHYEVQWANSADFSGVTQSQWVNTNTLDLERKVPCRERLWYRVRVTEAHPGGMTLGPWSNTVASLPGQGSFESLDDPLPVAPDLTMQGATEPRCRFSWSLPIAADVLLAQLDRYQLEEATLPDFADAQVVYEGKDTQFELIRPLENRRYYRVRARLLSADQSQPGPWSITLMREPVPRTRMVLQEEALSEHSSAERVRQIHLDLVRMSAARGDLFALLSLPMKTAAAEAQDWLDGLRRSLSGEAAASSYAALYHPWVQRKDAAGQVRPRPPEGSVMAQYALRTLEGGAWLSPANQSLANQSLSEVLGLERHFDDSQWASLHQPGVNLLRDVPGGFAPLTAMTLSNGDWDSDADLRDVNVRRLLILLRRLALREGNDWVFDSNTIALRRRIQHHFEHLLGRLYRQGAFRGARASEAYQVRVDDSLNAAQDVDAGRLTIELRVAPSRPLQFITVRLVQTGTGGLSVETA